MAREPKSHMPTGGWPVSKKGSHRIWHDSRSRRFLDTTSGEVAPPSSAVELSNPGRVAEAPTQRHGPLPPARQDVPWSEAADRVLPRHHDLFVKLADK